MFIKIKYTYVYSYVHLEQTLKVDSLYQKIKLFLLQFELLWCIMLIKLLTFFKKQIL